MTTKQLAYDHPAYLAILPIATGQVNGNAGTSTKFSAFLDMKVKAIALTPTTANTSNDIVNIVKISGTTTTTTAYGTFGSGATTGTSITPSAATSQVSLTQGDVFYVQKGTDATGTYVGMLECVVQPSATPTL